MTDAAPTTLAYRFDRLQQYCASMCTDPMTKDEAADAAHRRAGRRCRRARRAHPAAALSLTHRPETYNTRRARTGQQRGAAGGRVARALVQRPAALAVQREHQVVERHQRRAVADRHARAAQALDQLAEALLHVHLPCRARRHVDGTARASHLQPSLGRHLMRHVMTAHGRRYCDVASRCTRWAMQCPCIGAPSAPSQALSDTAPALPLTPVRLREGEG